MTKPVSRKMAVDTLLDRVKRNFGFYLPCTICFDALEPGQDIEFDHHHADVFDGPHEYQNLRPVHKACHKTKTAKDISANAKVKRIRGETKTGAKAKFPTKPMGKKPPGAGNGFPPRGSTPMRKKT